MTEDSGRRVTISPAQVQPLAAMAEQRPGAIEIVQDGSVLCFFNGFERICVDARGHECNPQHPDQESLC